MKRNVTTYLVLARHRGYGGKARLVRTTQTAPTLSRGEVAVKIQVSVPDEAFEPVRFAPAPVDFELSNTIRADEATITIEQQP
jgi:hypothetical protein